MSISLFVVKGETQLLALYPEIKSLFLRCFGKPLDQKLWKWAYVDNPCGSPCVAIAMDQDHIIGHYATIPTRLSNYDGVSLSASLSMTTMVDKAYIRENLFQRLAEMVYNKLAIAGCDLVYGYPNVRSRPGFQKRLGWKIDHPMYIAKTSKNAYVNSIAYRDYFYNSKSFTLDVSSDQLADWRFNKPGSHIFFKDGAYYKKHENSLDLLQVIDHSCFESCDLDLEFNSLLYTCERSSDHPEYSGGHKLLSRFGSIQLFSQMSCSDVF